MKTISAIYYSPMGLIVIESDGQSLVGLRFIDKKESDDILANRNADAEIPILVEVLKWLDDYFAGKRPTNVPRLNPQGTAFQRRVWQALFTIGYGETKTYGEIARMVGCKSAQAVGQAIGHNPIALIIPCHRVHAANGKIGGYRYGIDLKQLLLDFERRE